MTSRALVLVHEDRNALITGIADRFISLMNELLHKKDVVHVVLTGGTVGTDALAAVGEPSRSHGIDWGNVHFWWGDERWLAADDGERNDLQAHNAFLSHISCPPENIHRFPASDGEYDLDSAAREYSAELAKYANNHDRYPLFDLVLLGVGPDGHIASLFPGREGIREREATVIPVRNSPKPPPERLSLTLPVINSADRVWLCLAGADKASALGLALAGANVAEVPAAGAAGRITTAYLVDQAAAAEVPQDLLSGGVRA